MVKLHPLLRNLDEEEVEGDGPDDIGLRRSGTVDVSMVDSADSELAPVLEQLRRSLENLQGNHEQMLGVSAGVTRAQTALDNVLFKHASAQEYAALQLDHGVME